MIGSCDSKNVVIQSFREYSVPVQRRNTSRRVLVAGHSLACSAASRNYGIDIHSWAEDEMAKSSTHDDCANQVRLIEANKLVFQAKRNCETRGTYIVGHEDQHEEERQEDSRSVQQSSG